MNLTQSVQDTVFKIQQIHVGLWYVYNKTFTCSSILSMTERPTVGIISCG
jgi:hypothetical protein